MLFPTMTPAAIDAKFAELAGLALPAEAVAEIAGRIATLPESQDIEPLLACLAGAGPVADPFR